jgi:hypothetical protein
MNKRRFIGYLKEIMFRTYPETIFLIQIKAAADKADPYILLSASQIVSVFRKLSMSNVRSTCQRSSYAVRSGFLLTLK